MYSSPGGICTPAFTQACATSRGAVPGSMDNSTVGWASGNGRFSHQAMPPASKAAASAAKPVSAKAQRMPTPQPDPEEPRAMRLMIMRP